MRSPSSVPGRGRAPGGQPSAGTLPGDPDLTLSRACIVTQKEQTTFPGR